jgi:hypothetical protein
LAAKIELSYGAGQTVDLLALRLQWFESTPTQAASRAVLQVVKSLGGRLKSHSSFVSRIWLQQFLLIAILDVA